MLYSGGKVVAAKKSGFLVCPCLDKVNLVDTNSGKIVHTIPSDEVVTCAVLSPDERYAVLASRSLQLCLWDLSTRSLVKKWKGHVGPVVDMAYNADGSLMATCSSDNSVKVWDMKQYFLTHEFRGHTGVVTVVKFHPQVDKYRVFSGSVDNTVKIWDLQRRKCLHTFTSHMGAITAIEISTCGTYMITSSRDKVINIHHLLEKSLIRTIPLYESIESVKLWPTSMNKYFKSQEKNPVYFITCGELGTLRVLDMLGNSVFEQQKTELSQSLSDVIIMEEQNTVMSITQEQNFVFYNVVDSQTHSDNLLELTKFMVGHNDEVTDVKFLNLKIPKLNIKDTKKKVVKNEDDETNQTELGHTGFKDDSVSKQIIEENQKNVFDNKIAVSTNTNQLRIFDINSNNCQVLAGHSGIILSVSVSHDGKYICTSGKDNTIRIWDIENFRCVGLATEHTADVSCVAFTKKSNNYVFSGSQDKTIKAWDVRNLTQISASSEVFKYKSKTSTKAHEKDVNALSVAPNDKLLATASQDKLIKIWDAETLQLVGSCKGHKRTVWSVEFSNVDKCVVSCSSDATIKIWSLDDFTCLKTLEGHDGAVLKCAFISHGMQVVSTDAVGVLKVWNVKTSECVNTFDSHEEKIWGLHTSGEGNAIVTGGADSLINIWCDVSHIIDAEKLEAEEKRVLDEQKLSNYVLNGQWEKAVILALELKQPKRLWQIFGNMQKSNKPFEDTISKLTQNSIVTLLEFIRDWNTNSKYCGIAHLVLQCVLSCFPQSQHLNNRHFKEMISGLLPYTIRHFERVDRILQKTYLLDYTLYNMHLLQPIEKSIKHETLTKIEAGAIIDVDINDNTTLPASRDVTIKQESDDESDFQKGDVAIDSESSSSGEDKLEHNKVNGNKRKIQEKPKKAKKRKSDL